jgi:isocitrate dehydrogenase kinase/phosphatase
MSGLFTTALLLLAGIILYRFREVIIAALKRFDRRNVARLEEEMRDRSDPVAHYKHTLRLADEQVEPVAEIEERDAHTGDLVTRFLFQGEKFARRHDAELARNAVVVELARNFYRDLPAALAARRGDERLH